MATLSILCITGNSTANLCWNHHHTGNGTRTRTGSPRNYLEQICQSVKLVQMRYPYTPPNAHDER